MTSTASQPLQITLNGEPRALPGQPTVSDLVQQLSLDIRKVAVERNLAIVPRTAYADTPILDGDRIEIVGFIGGG
jgi:thiamine biosynthesis protein ThiS